ncbi:MAG: DUF2892 domain-containing protein [Halomonas sp.]|nr:DUF2892 domain-containing protein [Halomonas sp.]
MTRHVGGIDKLARIVIGALLIGLAIPGQVGARGFIGLLPLVTGLLNTCPAYRLLGISTCRRQK